MPASPTLLELQQCLLAALYDAGSEAESDAAAALVDGHGLAPQARVRIYRHSSGAIQAGALRTAYPAVQALVGAEYFEQTAQSYRRAFPSRSGNLQDFGARFAEHLAALPALRPWPYLPDVARLECLRQQVALAADAAPMPARQHAGGAPARALALHPGARCLASAHAVLSIWRYAMQPTPERLQLPATGERVLLWRAGGQVAMAALDAASHACIDALAQGRGWHDACQAARALDPGFDADACFASLDAHGLLRPGGAPHELEEPQPCPSFAA